ncbi:alpha/beta hydrolase [Clostridium vitabionis]|uniref:alpha/beta hydrolase n=1 Tax=Clostridium vitabionis TaxID=2784388 RepID=UPI00188A8374|nr:alpha/beta hydrolase [Clostridium vitabionis]
MEGESEQMRVKNTNLHPYPGYEAHVAMNLETDAGGNVSMRELQETIKSYRLGAGTTMHDEMIPGTEPGSQLKIRIIRPAGLPEKAPMIMDIHGGGYVSGNLDIDNYRNISLAEMTPAIVVSVEYRLATRETPFPAQLMDCRTAYLWLHDHASEIGGDPEKIGIHGTSAGGSLSAGLSLYLRDQGEPLPALTVLMCPGLTLDQTESKLMFGKLGMPAESYYDEIESIYTAPDGNPVSYYAMPAYCRDLKDLNPHMIVVAEYDPLRDEGLQYASRLLSAGVPTEILCAPRVTHGFCVVDQPLTRWVHRGVAASFRREFGMRIKEF